MTTTTATSAVHTWNYGYGYVTIANSNAQDTCSNAQCPGFDTSHAGQWLLPKHSLTNIWLRRSSLLINTLQRCWQIGVVHMEKQNWERSASSHYVFSISQGGVATMRRVGPGCLSAVLAGFTWKMAYSMTQWDCHYQIVCRHDLKCQQFVACSQAVLAPDVFTKKNSWFWLSKQQKTNKHNSPVD